jgi:subtilisin family serine protease
MEFTGRLLARVRDEKGVAKDPSVLQRAASLLEPLNATPIAELDEYLVPVPQGEDENSLATKLLGSGLFDWVRPDWMLYPTAGQAIIPNDPSFDQQWHLNQIQAPQAWEINTGLPTMVVALVDTGVDLTHPDLVSSLVPGYASYFLARRAQTDTSDPVCQDTNGHGTMTAGTVAAAGNNGLGVCGVGWNLRVMPIRATNTSGGSGASFSDLQNGAMWASAHGARIVNVSFAGVAEPAVETLGATLRSRGVLLIWPMDDNNVDYGTSFDHPDVTVPSGTDQQDNLYALSSHGLGVDIAAPAVSIVTTTLGGGYGAGTGNSFAGPIVAGAAATVWGIAPWMSPADVERVLTDSADDIGPPGPDNFFGAGRVNLRSALWLTVVRQSCWGNTPQGYNAAALSLEDLYQFNANPMDVNADGVVDYKDAQCVEAYFRSNEAKDMVSGRP